jgi:integrase
VTTYTVIPQSAYDRTDSQAIIKYVKSVAASNKRTGHEYLGRLRIFEEFIKSNYSFTIDELTIKKTFVTDIYDLLSSYVTYLINRNNLSNSSIKNRVINVKNFLEFYDIDINPYKFKKRVKVPRVFNQYKEALPKEEIIRMLENCKNFKLKTFLLLLATTGARASEAASIRLRDIDFKNSKVNFRAEFTKTKVSRYSFMTSELSNFLHEWIETKYRERRLTSKNRKDMYVKPLPKPDDLVFSSAFTYERDILNKKDKKSMIAEYDLISNLYNALVIEFNKLVKQLKIGYESGNKRHIYTFHSFRRYYRTLISDLVGQDFAEWSIGHAFSTYWRKGEKEKYQIFKKIESYLLLLDQSAIHLKSMELNTRLESVEKENLELRKEQEENRLNMVEINNVLDRIHALEQSVAKGKK